MNQIDERRRAAIHDGHFRRIELDDDVVDAQADERREKMFDGADVDRIARQTRREIDAAKVADARRHFEAAKIGTAETDAEVGGSGLEGERHLLARMETNSPAGNWSTKRPLCIHQRISRLRV